MAEWVEILWKKEGVIAQFSEIQSIIVKLDCVPWKVFFKKLCQTLSVMNSKNLFNQFLFCVAFQNKFKAKKTRALLLKYLRPWKLFVIRVQNDT